MSKIFYMPSIWVSCGSFLASGTGFAILANPYMAFAVITLAATPVYCLIQLLKLYLKNQLTKGKNYEEALQIKLMSGISSIGVFVSATAALYCIVGIDFLSSITIPFFCAPAVPVILLAAMLLTEKMVDLLPDSSPDTNAGYGVG